MGRFDVDQKTDRHRLDAVADQRLEVLAVGRFGLVGDAEHGRLRRAIDVGVEHADARAFGSQRQRQVDGGGGFADAALAGRHGDDVLDVGDQLDAALHAVRDDLEPDVRGGGGHAVDALELVFDLLLDAGELALRRVAELDVDRNGAAVDLDVASGFGRNVILVGIRINQLFQCVLHLQFGNGHVCSSGLISNRSF
jgi:hypothetical protein